ncbi:MAG: hypothetical protein O9264_15505 [Leptospira sp.]|nr:hypothetical protein [Leptospira sp.]
MKQIQNLSISFISIICFCLVLTCKSTETDQDDPLKNSKKLIREGHKSLYYQGAVPIAGTSIKFIPPMEEGEIYIYGKKFKFAKEEFSKAITKASESIIVIKNGTKYSWSLADDVSKSGNEAVNYIEQNATLPGIYIMYESNAKAYGLIGSSFDEGMKAHNKVIQNSEQLRKDWETWAEYRFKDPAERDKTPAFQARMKSYNQIFKTSFDSFVYGYVDMDEALKSAWDEYYEVIDSGGWRDLYTEVHELRTIVSDSISSTWKETFFNYGEATKEELASAGKDIESIADGEGLSFSLLKAFVKTTKAIFYDAIIEPVGKIGVLSIGYIGVNAVVYPAAIISVGTTTSVYLLAETVTVAGKGVVYIIAPNVQLALGALLGSTEIVVGESYESLRAGGKASSYVVRKTSKYTTKGAAIITEKSGKYILAPSTLIGVTTSQTIVGGGLSLSGTTAGGVVTATSAGLQTTTYVASKTTAAGVGVTGTVTSFGTGTVFGIYYLGKSVGVPMGVGVGSGVVLSYEVMSQMSAHSLLAVADCSYLVLSLEGGKWVVYGVKDVSNKANGLFSGAIVNLEQVRKEGGTIVKVPLTQEEADRILEPKKKKK